VSSRLLAAALFLCALALPSAPARGAQATTESAPQTVTVPSGKLRLTGLLWKPAGPGPFPAILFAHGSGPTDPASALDVGPEFAGHGYLLLYLFRRGDGLSARQGAFLGDVLARERKPKGEEARNHLQLKLLTTDHLNDVLAGIAYLKTRSDVEKGRLAVVGHSFGGQLALLAAEKDRSLRAAVCFAPAAVAWGENPELRQRLLEAARNVRAPVLLIFASNDFSTLPGETLSAERKRLGLPGALKVYPPVGSTAAAGHGIVYSSAGLWEKDVFEFLDRSVTP
jgi:carboxymethylenebutenolidase